MKLLAIDWMAFAAFNHMAHNFRVYYDNFGTASYFSRFIEPIWGLPEAYHT